MKLKRFCLLAAITLGALAASVQSKAQTKEGETFRPHWFVQLQAGAGHTVGEASFGDLLSPAAALSAGYRFTPVWGIRAGVSGWQAKGAWVSPFTDYKYNYLQGNVDAMLNLSNLFCKYKPNRVFNAYLFAGVGLNGGFNNDEAVALAAQGYELRYLWNDNLLSPAGRVGLGADIRLCDLLALNVEVNTNILSDKFNSKKAGNVDWQSNLMVGLTFNLGKKSKPAPAPEPVQEVVPTPEPVKQPVVEKKEEPKVEPKVVEVAALTENVFFKINSSVIRQSEEAKIANLVAYLQKYPEAKVVLTGYADEATGNATINKSLSEKRALAVAKALKDKGIAVERIQVDFKGDTVQPFSVAEENRVTICVAK